MAIKWDAIFSISDFLSPEFSQYVVIEDGLETIITISSTSNNVKVLCDAARKMSSFSVGTTTKDIMVSS
jgi:hypothetical protein